MTPFWHLTTLSCIPYANPQARLKEQRILREAALDAAMRAETLARQPGRSRFNGRSKSASLRG